MKEDYLANRIQLAKLDDQTASQMHLVIQKLRSRTSQCEWQSIRIPNEFILMTIRRADKAEAIFKIKANFIDHKNSRSEVTKEEAVLN